MNIIYTDHARGRMQLRGISEQMVEEALTFPDKREVGHEAKQIVFKSFISGTIKVVYTEERSLVIITTIWHTKKYEN